MRNFMSKRPFRDLSKHVAAGRDLPRRSEVSANARGKAQLPRLYGRHAVLAAMNNPNRVLRRLYGVDTVLKDFDIPKGLEVRTMDVADLSQLVPRDAVHQSIVLEVEPLDLVFLEDVLPAATGKSILMLDQVTDPHNVGAIIRSAAAFGAAFIITQDRNSPQENGALAKAASGCLETMPWVRAVNLARALEQIAEAGWWRIGMAGEASVTIDQAVSAAPTCLVLGAEGEGLRQNVAAHCDVLAKLPISDTVESLNVSNAAAVALYAIGRR
jgi:23S rRNA (guanosine2251-2'-O)-methyltransferase